MATPAKPSTDSPNGKQPREVAVEMLSRVYDQLPAEAQDLSKDEFINESLAVLGDNKSKPKSNLILPEGF
jgi:hypothetical protein